jgi:hypothetical protein
MDELTGLDQDLGEERVLTLKSQDDQEFEVKESVARLSELIKTMCEGYVDRSLLTTNTHLMSPPALCVCVS